MELRVRRCDRTYRDHLQSIICPELWDGAAADALAVAGQRGHLQSACRRCVAFHALVLLLLVSSCMLTVGH